MNSLESRVRVSEVLSHFIALYLFSLRLVIKQGCVLQPLPYNVLNKTEQGICLKKEFLVNIYLTESDIVNGYISVFQLLWNICRPHLLSKCIRNFMENDL